MPPSVRPALAAVLLLLALPALAQPGERPAGSVVATVVDAETGAPLPQATVALYGAADSSFVTGGAADADGRVTIDGVGAGRYQARVSFIGYTTQRVDGVEVAAGAPTDLGEVRLASGVEVLGEAEVTARRDFVEQQADRTVYNVQEQAVTAGGSAIETLQTLPSLEVDTDGNVSLRGNQNVVIQIDGRPVPVRGAFLAALLRQIPADKVERVEVIPNPSAKYEPDGMGGIVNIVLVEGTDRGLSGGLTLGGGTELSGQAGANLAYQKGKWDLSGQYGYRYNERPTSFLGSVRALDGSFALLSDGANERDESSHFFNGSATYELADKTTLSAEGSFGLRSGGQDGRTLFERTTNGGAPALTTRETDNDTDGLNGDLALVFRRQFADAAGGGAAEGGGGRRGGWGGRGGPRGGGGTQSGHELALETRYTRFDNEDLGLFTDLVTGDVLTGVQSQTADETTDEASFQADYTRPVGALKLEVGAKANAEWVASDSDVQSGDDMGSLVPDLDQTNAFDYDRQILAGYVQGAHPLGPVQVQVGLRAEVARRNFDLRTPLPPGASTFFDPDAPTDQTYTSLFPSAFVTYALAPGTLVKGAYSRRVERPRTFFLNPFPDLSDTTSVRVGNPTLRPEYTDSYELTLQYKFFATLTPFLRHTTDAITRRARVDPETGRSVFTVSNLDSQTNYGADLTLFGQLGPVRGFVSGSLYQAVLTDPTSTRNVDALAYNARTSLQVKVREGTDLQAFVFYNGPQQSVDGERKGFAFSTLGLNQRITEQLSLAARVNDPFGLAKFEFVTDDGAVIRDSSFDPSIRQASFTLTYTFGSNQQRPQQQQPQGGGLDDGFGI
ncbi:TonB-dependent receptor [Rubrivirga sp. S365]|uniref:TonB-dependent receptor domain-containing protein n=1 Tax=Rubrivirga sp. S365 TaxID=3076080 RepID=UPI0028CA87F8|nr:TonB-dependent receptor [Rubrivirga sp. S365]MDT7857767.1 TonB-dependent receptor [Rubrivirga sp. S365]